ncbi:MAG: 5-oxoprolinase subunit PxpB, partial [Chthoniobacterales bacterium]
PDKRKRARRLMTISPLGDSALTIHVREEFATDPRGCLREVEGVLNALQTAPLPGVVEMAPAFASVTVFYDPAGSGFEEIKGTIAGLLESNPKLAKKKERLVEIPVCYEGEFAPDLGLVAKRARLTQREAKVAHASARYRVSCLGFAPGFPYLAGLPRLLATPRRVAPRVQMAAGSVAIGGGQTGIYPQASPGGWNVIGRTPLRLFDVGMEQPALLTLGDRVRFRAISRAEFEDIRGIV